MTCVDITTPSRHAPQVRHDRWGAAARPGLRPSDGEILAHFLKSSKADYLGSVISKTWRVITDE